MIAKKFMEEGGFIVMKNDNGKLVFIDIFFSSHKFYDSCKIPKS